MRRRVLVGIGCAVLMCAATTARAEWTAELIATLDGFTAPESVAVDPETGAAYVTNMAPKMGDDGPRYWEDDGDGYLSKIVMKDGEPEVEYRWVEHSEEVPLNAPKGITCGRMLVMNDNTRWVVYSPKDPTRTHAKKNEAAGRMNDIVIKDGVIYSSDTEKGVIHTFNPREGKVGTLPAPESINGLTWAGDKLFVVSWDLHEIYEVDPEAEGDDALKPFGLADNFGTLDSIEVLDDGTFLVTDFKGNKIWTVTADRKTPTVIAEMETPADVGLDRENGLLYVPSVEGDIVNVYKLEKK